MLVYGVEFWGSLDCQSAGRRSPWTWRLSMSEARARVTTSAWRPSMTERAWAPEPPWDCFTTTSSPVFAFQYAEKAVL